ncbi:MAG: Gfo/Idh/MocA family oxidoreductase [Vicinamibacterales bacterium]
MLKVALVGCGKIADEHAAAIQRVQGCEIVGVCDREPLMAQQLAERFPVKRHFSDLAVLLNEARPDVVHITTPPESHFDLARQCLERGCHVYVEKPFTLFEKDARTLIALADDKGLKLTVGHDGQFGHAARRMRALVQKGYLGDGPVHVESYYGYELGETYARALLGDTNHWVRRLPGQLLHNVISHGIARISEFLTTESPQVRAYGFTSAFLRGMGESDIIDELRVIIGDEDGNTAYFTFSSQMRPLIHECRVYGSKNGLVLDPDQETLIKLRGTRFTSYAEKFIPPALLAKQYLGNMATNMRAFLAMDFHMKSGLKYLIESFYRSISDGTAVPIPYREILLTARIMDAIFTQLQAPVAEAHEAPSEQAALSK